jgi:predicted PurR-regulated permease PerM
MALSVLALVAIGVLIRLSMPIGFGVFFGILLAFVLQPTYDLMRARRIGASSAALLCSLGSSLALAGIVFGLGYVVASELVGFIQALPGNLAPGGSLHEAMLRTADFLRAHHVDPDGLLLKVQESAASNGGQYLAAAGAAAGELIIFFIIMTMSNFNVLLRWKKIVASAERNLPIEPSDTRKLFREFQQVGRQVVFGTVAAGLIQGVLGGLVCWVTGVPKAIFFGATTAFLSAIPVVGSLVVWAGVGIFRIATGHLVAGVIELILGALLVGVLVDDVIRPRLVGGGKKFPALLTFIGLLGGIPIFGPSGLIVGPVLVALCVAVLKSFSEDSEPVPKAPVEVASAA